MICIDKIPDVTTLYLTVLGATVYLTDEENVLAEEVFDSPEDALENCNELFETMNSDSKEIRDRGGRFPVFALRQTLPG